MAARQTRPTFSREATGNDRRVRRASAWLTWFALLEGLWELLVGTFQRTEVLAGLIAAAIGATFAVALRELGLMRFTLAPAAAVRAARLAWQLPVEFLVLTWVLVASVARGRRVRGRWVRVRYAPGGGDSGRWRRAFAVTIGTATPNGLVVDLSDEEALVHSLAPGLPGGREVI